jgi:hypothetical protein
VSQEDVEVVRSLYEGWLKGEMGLEQARPRNLDGGVGDPPRGGLGRGDRRGASLPGAIRDTLAGDSF